jgi:hypothetical protein
VLTKIKEHSLGISCTITKMFNEEKSVWPSYFLESFDFCVGHIVDYSFVFSQHSGCVRMYFMLYTILMYYSCIFISILWRIFV